MMRLSSSKFKQRKRSKSEDASLHACKSYQTSDLGFTTRDVKREFGFEAPTSGLLVELTFGGFVLVGFSRLYSVIGRVPVSLQSRKNITGTYTKRERDADQEALAKHNRARILCCLRAGNKHMGDSASS
jgi:hypothetical protein